MEKENLFAALVLGLLGGLIAISLISKPKKLAFTKEKFVSTIDSVWYTSPGQENTLQTDYHYYGRLSNDQVVKSNSRPFNIGDSVKYIYYRYETTKTKKKQ
jgi:hypothetical protein